MVQISIPNGSDSLEEQRGYGRNFHTTWKQQPSGQDVIRHKFPYHMVVTALRDRGDTAEISIQNGNGSLQEQGYGRNSHTKWKGSLQGKGIRHKFPYQIEVTALRDRGILDHRHQEMVTNIRETERQVQCRRAWRGLPRVGGD